MDDSTLITLDGLGNLALGLVLILFPRQVVELLGTGGSESAIYWSVFGGVIFGIGIALVVILGAIAVFELTAEFVRRRTRRG